MPGDAVLEEQVETTATDDVVLQASDGVRSFPAPPFRLKPGREVQMLQVGRDARPIPRSQLVCVSVGTQEDKILLVSFLTFIHLSFVAERKQKRRARQVYELVAP